MEGEPLPPVLREDGRVPWADETPGGRQHQGTAWVVWCGGAGHEVLTSVSHGHPPAVEEGPGPGAASPHVDLVAGVDAIAAAEPIDEQKVVIIMAVEEGGLDPRRLRGVLKVTRALGKLLTSIPNQTLAM